jgi:iron complex transport system permease protein
MLLLLFIFTILGVLGCMILAISLGAKDVSFNTVLSAIFHYNPKLTEQQIIHELRLPRVIGAAIVGASFAVAGCLMQGVTRNPLADAGILGINAGAMFIVTLCFALFPSIPYSLLMIFSFIGAVLSTLLIFIIGSSVPGGLTPMRLTISGAVIAALLHSLSAGVAIYFDLSQDLAFWYAGGVAGIKWDHLNVLVPVILITAIIIASTFIKITFIPRFLAISSPKEIRETERPMVIAQIMEVNFHGSLSSSFHKLLFSFEEL